MPLRHPRAVAVLAMLTASAALLAGLLLPASGRTQGVDETCQLALTRLEPTTTNALLLDTNATYWVVSYTAAPGTRLRIDGLFPHARYISYNVYDPQARPIDALSDVQISPAAGSVNPFLPGASRTPRSRGYTVYLDFGPAPAHRAPNTMYAGTQADGSANYTGTLWYRVYMPDHGLDLAGGVGLPQVTLEPASDTTPPSSGSPCQSTAPPTLDAVNQAIADNDGGPLPILGSYPGQSPPKWTLFVNLQVALKEILLDNPTGQPAQPAAGQIPTSNGAGFFANKDNAYVYAPTSRGYGQLIVIHGRAPTFADTRRGAPTMPAGGQTRYFSFCQYDPLSQRVIACVPDDQIVRDAQGGYTIVVSTASQRPANATAACGVTWLPWGPTSQGLLIYRQLLADPGFAASIAHVGQPGREQAVMGAYFPSASYLPDAAAFQARGCPDPGSTAGAGTNGARLVCPLVTSHATTGDRRLRALTVRGAGGSRRLVHLRPHRPRPARSCPPLPRPTSSARR